MSSCSIPSSVRHVLIGLNPRAGMRSGRPLVDRLVELLSAERFVPEVMSDIDQLAERAAALWRAGELRCVVSAGGDGTAALLANRTPAGVPLAILPLGTENLLAKHLALDRSPEQVCRVVGHGHIVRLDAGRAGDRLFLVLASCGFDAEVVRRLHRDRTGNIHHLHYLKPILDSLRSYDYPELRLRWEVASVEGGRHSRSADHESISARWAFVVNLPRYAIGLQIAPRASGQDGLLDLCAFKEGSLWNGLRYLGGVWMRQHESWTDCVTRRITHVRIESDEQVPYQLDGDPGGFLPLDIEVIPQRLTLLTPPPHREALKGPDRRAE